MLQLQNTTPFAASFAVLPDRRGIDTLFVIVKGTVRLRPKLSLAPVQVPVNLADEYHGDPAASSLRASSDLHIGKTGTDVLLTGHARAPREQPTRRMQVTMTVAGRRSVLHVSGDRTWRDGQPSEAEPFISMPLVWERAFGGTYAANDTTLAEERNPVGLGFAGKRSADEMEGLPVPNIEEASGLLQQPGQVVAPMCFAPVAPSWLPRRAYAGTYDERWRRTRAPFVPDDFDPRFFQTAAGAFAFDRYLPGGEPVEVHGVLPDGPISFSIPSAHLSVAVRVAGEERRPPVHLETVLIEPDDNRASFTWRAAVPCDRQALKVETIAISREPGRQS